MRALFATLAVGLATGPASACLNDVELPSHEREFRSQYATNVVAALTPQSPGEAFLHGVLYSAGGVLLVGAVGLAVTRRRAEA